MKEKANKTGTNRYKIIHHCLWLMVNSWQQQFFVLRLSQSVQKFAQRMTLTNEWHF